MVCLKTSFYSLSLKYHYANSLYKRRIVTFVFISLSQVGTSYFKNKNCCYGRESVIDLRIVLSSRAKARPLMHACACACVWMWEWSVQRKDISQLYLEIFADIHQRKSRFNIKCWVGISYYYIRNWHPLHQLHASANWIEITQLLMIQLQSKCMPCKNETMLTMTGESEMKIHKLILCFNCFFKQVINRINN